MALIRTTHMQDILCCSPLLRITSAVVAILSGIQLSGAAVVYTDLTASPLAVPSTLDGLLINFVTGATSGDATALPGYDFNAYNDLVGIAFYSSPTQISQGVLFYQPTILTVGGPRAYPLAEGDPIDSSQRYLFCAMDGTDFYSTRVNYVGLRFLNESTSQLNYGWVKLSTTSRTGFPATVFGYAYEDSGASIFAGQIPEPTAIALLMVLGQTLCMRNRGVVKMPRL